MSSPSLANLECSSGFVLTCPISPANVFENQYDPVAAIAADSVTQGQTHFSIGLVESDCKLGVAAMIVQMAFRLPSPIPAIHMCVSS